MTKSDDARITVGGDADLEATAGSAGPASDAVPPASTVADFDQLCQEADAAWRTWQGPASDGLNLLDLALTYPEPATAARKRRVSRRTVLVVTGMQVAFFIYMAVLLLMTSTSTRARTEGDTGMFDLMAAGALVVGALFVWRFVRIARRPVSERAIRDHLPEVIADLDVLLAEAQRLGEALATEGRRRDVDALRETLVNFLEHEDGGLRRVIEKKDLDLTGLRRRYPSMNFGLLTRIRTLIHRLDDLGTGHPGPEPE